MIYNYKYMWFGFKLAVICDVIQCSVSSQQHEQEFIAEAPLFFQQKDDKSKA